MYKEIKMGVRYKFVKKDEGEGREDGKGRINSFRHDRWGYRVGAERVG